LKTEADVLALDDANAEEDALMMLRRKREPWML
jgi:hypothetical protein